MCKLREERNKLLSENIELSAQLAFVKDTKIIRQFSRRYEDRVVATAQVLAKHASDQEQYLLLDAGIKSGIKKDMIVVHHNNLVGVVEDIFPLYAKVRLITDVRSSISAYCAQTGEHGVVQGNNTDQLALLYVSHTKNVVVGDIVHSSGKGALFPRGFALGKITRAHVGDLYYDITLTPLITLSDIEYCSVLRV